MQPRFLKITPVKALLWHAFQADQHKGCFLEFSLKLQPDFWQPGLKLTELSPDPESSAFPFILLRLHTWVRLQRGSLITPSHKGIFFLRLSLG